MNSPAFTAPCGASVTSRTAFSGLSVSQCNARALRSRTASRPSRFSPRMISSAPDEPSEIPDAAPIADAVEESTMGFDGPEISTAVLEPEIEDDEEEYPPCEPPQHVLNGQAIKEAQGKFKRHETDSGSPEFQIATLTTRINYLTTHLKNNPKDFSTTRGLLKMVSTRRRLLKYVKKEDPKRFTDIIEGMNIRVSQQLRDI